jgi:hypothetical protein
VIDLLVMAAIFLAGLGLGRLSACLIGFKTVSRLETLIFETALGWVGLSMSFLALGVLGWLRTELVWGLILPLAALGAWFQSEPLRSKARPRFALPALSYLEWSVMVPAGALFLFTLLLALAPPSGMGMGWDGLSYHLTTIKLFVKQGRIVPIPSLVLSNYPMGMNILFTPGLMLGQAAAAQVLHFSMGLLAALAMASLAARYANRTVALLSPPLFLVIPLVQDEATWPMIDLGVTLYTCLALLALINWLETEDKHWLVVAGIMAGFSCSIKLTSIFGAAALGMLLLGLVLAKRPWRLISWVVPPLTFGVPLLLFGSPWYIKNYVMVGNPFMPYFYDVFGGAYWSPEANERYMLYLTSLGFKLPFFMLLAASVGCLLAAGFLALKTKDQPVVKMLLGYTLLWLALWLVSGSPQQRFLLPIYPVAVLLTIWLISTFTQRWAVLQPVLYGVVTLGLVVGLGRSIQDKGDMLAVGLGLESQEDFLSRKLYSYPAFQFANIHLPSSAKFLVFPENRTYYLDRSYIWGEPIGSAIIDYAHYNSPTELLNRLENLGITHVIVLRPAYPFWRQLVEQEPQLITHVEHAFELIDGLSSLGLREVFEANGVTIYALPDTSQAQRANLY